LGVIVSRMLSFSQAVVLFVGLITLLSACETEEKAPKGTLSEEKMATILSEIHLAEARVTRLQLKSLDSSLLIFSKLQSDIWKKQMVDTLVYKNSYNYYMSHPQKMTRIYEKVTKKIEAREKTKNIKF
jgi:hypothetical protein